MEVVKARGSSSPGMDGSRTRQADTAGKEEGTPLQPGKKEELVNGTTKTSQKGIEETPKNCENGEGAIVIDNKLREKDESNEKTIKKCKEDTKEVDKEVGKKRGKEEEEIRKIEKSVSELKVSPALIVKGVPQMKKVPETLQTSPTSSFKGSEGLSSRRGMDLERIDETDGHVGHTGRKRVVVVRSAPAGGERTCGLSGLEEESPPPRFPAWFNYYCVAAQKRRRVGH